MEEWACVFSFVTLFPPRTTSISQSIDFFFLINNEFKVSEENVVVFVETQKSENRLKSPDHLLLAVCL